MSAPNKSYDPVEVEALKPEEVDRARDAALAAIAAAQDLDALREARTAHAGDRSPLALANREIGALPPHAKAAAGKRVGQARSMVGKALAGRQEELEAERDERVLVEEAVDVTRTFVEDDRRIAAICHGPQLLISAGALNGRTLTCAPSIRDDVRAAGGNYRDEAVVADGNLLTSRGPDDLPQFCRQLVAFINVGSSS